MTRGAKAALSMAWVLMLAVVFSLPPTVARANGPDAGEQFGNAGPWPVEVAAAGRLFSFMSGRMAQLDASGRPHLVYGENGLYHAWFDGAGWKYEVADGSSRVGKYAALAFDSKGQPRAIYFDETNFRLKYAYKDASGWHAQIVDGTGLESSSSALAIDALDRPVIAHLGYRTVKLTRLEGGVWKSETVATGVGMQGAVSLTLDSAGQPRVIFAGDALRYAWKDGSGWHTSVIDGADVDYEVGFHNSLTLDANGYPHVAYYYGYPLHDLKYAYQDAGGWHLQDVDTGEDAGGYPSIAVASTGQPRISYGAGNQLKYAWRDQAGWHTETVDSSGGITSLILNAADSAAIGYFHWDANELRFARQGPTGWQIETVDANFSAGMSSLALDQNGFGRVSFEDTINCDLKYAWEDSAGWHTETVDGEGCAGLHNSLALDQHGNPHIAYWDLSYGRVRYAWRDAAGWQRMTVDENESAGYLSLALDQDGRPRISYGGKSGLGLKYAYQDASGWHFETVDPDAHLRYSTSLALDSTGAPRIAYGDFWPEQGLKYARRTAGGWQTETVDSAGGVGEFPSLQLTTGDEARIAYYDRTNGDLKLAWQDGAEWHLDVVDREGDTGALPSLKIYGDDYLQVSYTGDYCQTTAGCGSLKFAYEDANGWHYLTLDAGGSNRNVYSSLALDAAGRAQVAYTQSNDGKLLYASAPAAPTTGLQASNDSPTDFMKPTTLRASVSTGTDIVYSWDFGDGATGVGATVTHTYRSGGVYTAVVTATNPLSAVSATTEVTIVAIMTYLPLIRR